MLLSNFGRLTTFLDVYQTISDLATCRLNALPDQKPNFNEKRRYSLWREHIPPARDCWSARVPYEYCMCGRPITLKSDLAPVKQLANRLVASLNSRITQFKGKCAVFTLDKVVEARLLHQASPYGNNNHTHMELVFTVRPNGAQYRGQGVLREGETVFGRWDSQYNIDRLDAYGSTGSCVQSWYQKYCYCKK
jgi:hypothetical protein